ncbi:hypothetical protein SDC9_152639 [bioreactor metagenome]|uniref:Uncharacterized protein n=1 Tax=bioreactor metagenome TaxID=1076179 RepID=A0A645EW05_9ZZZZ
MDAPADSPGRSFQQPFEPFQPLPVALQHAAVSGRNGDFGAALHIDQPDFGGEHGIAFLLLENADRREPFRPAEAPFQMVQPFRVQEVRDDPAVRAARQPERQRFRRRLRPESLFQRRDQRRDGVASRLKRPDPAIPRDAQGDRIPGVQQGAAQQRGDPPGVPGAFRAETDRQGVVQHDQVFPVGEIAVLPEQQLPGTAEDVPIDPAQIVPRRVGAEILKLGTFPPGGSAVPPGGKRLPAVLRRGCAQADRGQQFCGKQEKVTHFSNASRILRSTESGVRFSICASKESAIRWRSTGRQARVTSASPMAVRPSSSA